jgi:hypothetical protein
MSEDTIAKLPDPSGNSPDPLTDVIRSGARRLIEQAIEAELATLLAAFADHRPEDGRARLVRHGHLPEREILTGIGPVAVKVPRVRDRKPGANKITFTPSILPRYLRKAKSVEELLPWLYLKGVSTGDFSEALAALLGPAAKGLSAKTITRLKADWWSEYEAWEKRDLGTSFHYRAKSWSKPRRVVAKVEFHPGELFPRVGFIVTNRSLPNERVLAFYNDRGTAEQHIKEGEHALEWTRLACMRFAANAVRLQLHALAYSPANFLRTLVSPEPIENWSLTSLRERLVKTGARLVRHARYAVFQLAEAALPREVFAGVLSLINGLRGPLPTALSA